MTQKTKAIVLTVLVLVAGLLTFLVWVQTKALVITLGLLLVSLAALYVIARRF